MVSGFTGLAFSSPGNPSYHEGPGGIAMFSLLANVREYC